LGQDPEVTKQQINNALNAAADAIQTMLGLDNVQSGALASGSTGVLNLSTKIAQSELSDTQQLASLQAAGNLVNQIVSNPDPGLTPSEKAAALAGFFVSATQTLVNAEAQGKTGAEIQADLQANAETAVEIANAYAQ
jgi:hypothetical protein